VRVIVEPFVREVVLLLAAHGGDQASRAVESTVRAHKTSAKRPFSARAHNRLTYRRRPVAGMHAPSAVNCIAGTVSLLSVLVNTQLDEVRAKHRVIFHLANNNTSNSAFFYSFKNAIRSCAGCQ
jgi:hypothetical protein